MEPYEGSIDRHLSEEEITAATETAQRNGNEKVVRRLDLIRSLYANESFETASDLADLTVQEARQLVSAWNNDGLDGIRPENPNRHTGLREGYEGGRPAETWFKELKAAVIQEDRCVQCGTCIPVCPVDTIGVGANNQPELVEMCIGCSRCWDFCPRGGLRYERQWTITGGESNFKGAGDPITEYTARVNESWRDRTQDGGIVTAILVSLFESDEIDGALIARESDQEPWKAEPYLATTPEECIDNAGSFYNQTMALDNLNFRKWEEKLPESDPSELRLAVVGTPCIIEGIRALQDFDWDYGSHEEAVRAIEYTIALMCTKNFDYDRLIRGELEAERGIAPAEIGKLDVIHGDMIVYGEDGAEILREDIEHFHEAALAGCDECADFTGYCADLSVGSVGSPEGYSSVIIRTDTGLEAWQLTEPVLEYRDLEDRSAIGRLQSWDKRAAFDALRRPVDPDGSRFIPYSGHAQQYGVDLKPYDPSVKGEPGSSG